MDNHPANTVTIGPYAMRVVPNTHMADCLAQNGLNYEAHVVRWLRERLRPGQVFLDVGACWGFYALVANHLTGGDITTISIEPNLNNFHILTHNLVTNRLKRAVALSVGVAAGRTLLTYPGGWENVSGQTVVGGGDALLVGVGLDAVLPRCLYPDVVKMDVEGSEGLAIAGGVEALSACHAMAMEFCPEHIRNRGCEPQRVFEQVLDMRWKTITNLSTSRRVRSWEDLEGVLICDLALER